MGQEARLAPTGTVVAGGCGAALAAPRRHPEVSPTLCHRPTSSLKRTFGIWPPVRITGEDRSRNSESAAGPEAASWGGPHHVLPQCYIAETSRAGGTLCAWWLGGSVMVGDWCPRGYVGQLRLGLGVGWGSMVGLGLVLIEIHGGFGGSGPGTDVCQGTWWVSSGC